VSSNTNSKLLDDLIFDLKYLRKHEGITPARLQNANTVKQVLGRTDDAYEDCLEFIRAEIEELPDKVDGKSLLVAYGLLPECTDIYPLEKRRDWYGQQINLKRDAITDREDAAIDELAHKMIRASISRSAIDVVIPCKPGSIIQESVTVKVLVRDGRWVRTDEHHCLVLLADNTDELEFISALPSRIFTNDSSISKAVTLEDNLRHRLYLKQTYNRGSLVEVTFSLLPEYENHEQTLSIATRAQSVMTQRLEYEVVFKGRYPARIWSFCGLQEHDIETKRYKHKQIAISGRGIAKVVFRELSSSLYSGVAWEWNDAP
jgi:hypothetical protein